METVSVYQVWLPLCAAARNMSRMTCNTGGIGAFRVVRDVLRTLRCVASARHAERRNQPEPRNATCRHVLECVATPCVSLIRDGTRLDMLERARTCWNVLGCAGVLVGSVDRRPPMAINTSVTHDHRTQGALLRSSSCVSVQTIVLGRHLSTDATRRDGVLLLIGHRIRCRHTTCLQAKDCSHAHRKGRSFPPQPRPDRDRINKNVDEYTIKCILCATAQRHAVGHENVRVQAWTKAARRPVQRRRAAHEAVL